MARRFRWALVAVLLSLAAAAAVGTIATTGSGAGGASAAAGAAVLQHHNSAARGGLYIAPTLTRAAAAGLQRERAFQVPLQGPTYAQPLFWAAARPGDRDLLIAATQQNRVVAVDASSGAVVWQRSLGVPVPLRALPCGNIDPLGITGTPVIDPASRTLFLDAMTTPDGGRTKKHFILALSIDDGSTRPGWPVDVSATVRAGAVRFDSAVQYAATGNTFGASTWADGEAVIRLRPGPTFSGQPVDYFAPADWRELDATDTDLGGSGPVLIEVPGTRPSSLVLALGKDGNAYLLDRANLGGIGGAVAHRHVSEGPIINAAAVYTTAAGSYIVFRGRGTGCPAGQSGDLIALRIAPASPPSIGVAWCAAAHGRGSPMVTTTDGRSEAIVWTIAAEEDNRLRGFDGETGRPVFIGGGPADQMPLVRRFQTPIVFKGRIVVAADDQLVAFTTR